MNAVILNTTADALQLATDHLSWRAAAMAARLRLNDDDDHKNTQYNYNKS